MTEQHIIYYDEKYVVRSDHAGPYAVLKRQLYGAGRPWEVWGNSSQWHRSMGMPKHGKIFEILKLAAAKEARDARTDTAGHRRC
jgi:hypothetical protein